MTNSGTQFKSILHVPTCLKCDLPSYIQSETSISLGSVFEHQHCCIYPWKLNLCVGFVEKCWVILITSEHHAESMLNMVLQMYVRRCL